MADKTKPDDAEAPAAQEPATGAPAPDGTEDTVPAPADAAASASRPDTTDTAEPRPDDGAAAPVGGEPSELATPWSSRRRASEPEDAEVVSEQPAPDRQAEPDAPDAQGEDRTEGGNAASGSDGATDGAAPSEPPPAATQAASAGEDNGRPPAGPEATAELPPPARPAAPAPAEPPRRRGGGGVFLALVLGGVVAAVAGFVTARYLVPEGWPFDLPRAGGTQQPDPVELLGSRVSDQAAMIEALTGRLAAAEAALASPDAVDPAAIEGRIAAAEASVAALTARLDSLPAAPGTDPAALDALRAEIEAIRAAPAAPDAGLADQVAALQDQVAALSAAAEADRAALEERAAALRAEAEAAASAALGRAAVLRLQAALDSGAPLTGAIEELRAAGVAVPAVLADNPDGVPTLAALRDGFPEAARAALAAAVSVAPEAGLADRLGAFLRDQTGARSLVPRDGDDPDAILSRAEASLQAGDLDAALSQLDALPPEAAQAMAGWRQLAETRVTAVTAAADLAAGLPGN